MAGLGFWVAAAAMAGAVATILLTAMLRARGAVAADQTDMQVYKDQLAEVDRDVARGTLDAGEAARIRAEVGRRILGADRERTGAVGVSTDRRAVLPAAVVIGAILAAAGGYWVLGAPGYPDLPLQQRLAASEEWLTSRPSQAEAVAARPETAATGVDVEFLELMEKLRQAVADRPDDLQGLELLSRNEAALGNLAAAETAQRQLIAVKGDAATADDHAALAEVMITAAGGYVSPEAEAVLTEALRRDPENGAARYLSGLMFAQAGRFDRTFALWRGLLEDGPQDAPWIPLVREGIGDIAFRAGVVYEVPPTDGPSAGDIAAAEDMSEEDRQAMIEGMVAQLSDRLATEGGSVEDWNRLIRSLMVLERRDEAQAIYDEAKLRFEGRTTELSFLRLAAVETGLAP